MRREIRPVKVLFFLANLDRDIGRVFTVAFGNREKQLQQIFLQARHDPAHHAQIEQRDPVIVRDENVARMRVGVEETVDQNLLEISAEKFLGQRGAVEFHPGERAQIGDLFPRHELHREDARCSNYRSAPE